MNTLKRRGPRTEPCGTIIITINSSVSMAVVHRHGTTMQINKAFRAPTTFT
jgi:hypothetical protein